MNDHETMVISSLRYALGRRSYITSVTEDYIRKMLKKDKVSEGFLHVAIKDIEESQREVNLGLGGFGLHDWNPLLTLLKNTYEQR